MAIYSYDFDTLQVNVSSGIRAIVAKMIVRRSKIIPTSHVEDASKLEADGIVEFFQIHLSDNSSVIYVKMDSTVEWNGNEYQGTAIKLSGVGQFSDDETARPTLMLFNPAKVYSHLVDQGYLEGGTLTRYRVLAKHVEMNVPIFQRQKWKISRVASLRGDTITCELRDMMDGQNFVVPGRMYIPPDFPAVSY